MADLKDLQEMVKSGEFSKKLLEDEKFKTEVKKILKEENGIEITDEDIPEVVEELGKSLTEKSSGSQIKQNLSEKTLEDVSGGVSKAKVIKGVATIAGFILGRKASSKITLKFRPEIYKEYVDQVNKINKNTALDADDRMEKRRELREELGLNMYKLAGEQALEGAVKAAGGIATGYGSYKLADYLCKKFNIK